MVFDPSVPQGRSAQMTVGLVDYGMGNLQSVRNACEYLGYPVQQTSTPEGLESVQRLILPGVGAFAQGMKNLRASGLEPALKKAVLEDKKPLLGICLGMQLLADRGVEGGDTEGLGLIPGVVKRLDDREVRLPHIGWNDIRVNNPTPVLTQDLQADYYFVHSYYFDAQNSGDVIAVTDYGITFPCAVGRGKTLGVQFHPEKSHRFGLELLKKFLSVC